MFLQNVGTYKFTQYYNPEDKYWFFTHTHMKQNNYNTNTKENAGKIKGKW
jgi:hypothetical protein